MNVALSISGSSHPEVFLGKGVLKIYNKFTGGHQCRSAIRHGCSPVNLQHIFRTLFPRNTSGWLLLYLRVCLGINIILFLDLDSKTLNFAFNNLLYLSSHNYFNFLFVLCKPLFWILRSTTFYTSHLTIISTFFLFCANHFFKRTSRSFVSLQ